MITRKCLIHLRVTSSNGIRNSTIRCGDQRRRLATSVSNEGPSTKNVPPPTKDSSNKRSLPSADDSFMDNPSPGAEIKCYSTSNPDPRRRLHKRHQQQFELCHINLKKMIRMTENLQRSNSKINEALLKDKIHRRTQLLDPLVIADFTLIRDDTLALRLENEDLIEKLLDLRKEFLNRLEVVHFQPKIKMITSEYNGPLPGEARK